LVQAALVQAALVQAALVQAALVQAAIDSNICPFSSNLPFKKGRSFPASVSGGIEMTKR
jgi:hypothetical protein